MSMVELAREALALERMAIELKAAKDELIRTLVEIDAVAQSHRIQRISDIAASAIAKHRNPIRVER